MKQQKAIYLILEEMGRAVEKFPEWPTDQLHAKAILDEEVGELEKAILQLIYEPKKSSQEHVMEEAVQAAAMAIRFLISTDKYLYRRSVQHHQEDG